MKEFNLFWFTQTNIDTRRILSSDNTKFSNRKLTIDLTRYLKLFEENKLWERKKYRSEYSDTFNQEDLSKINQIKIHFYSKLEPYSNWHSYENVISDFINIDQIEKSKIASSGIREAFQIAVIEVKYTSENEMLPYLTYANEKDIDAVFSKGLGPKSFKTMNEVGALKSLIIEMIQFLVFNLHINFPSYRYSSSFERKPTQIGFSILKNKDSYHYETDKIDFLSHYILYDSKNDILKKIMDKTAKFWHKENPSIHFFLDSLKGNYITIHNFSKLVFTIESFFSEGASNDFITLTVPLLIAKDIKRMKQIRRTLRNSFQIRNNYVHGKKIIDIRSKVKEKENVRVADIFFELKNIIIDMFAFYINEGLFLNKNNVKINHELLFKYLPKGIYYDS